MTNLFILQTKILKISNILHTKILTIDSVPYPQNRKTDTLPRSTFPESKMYKLLPWGQSSKKLIVML